MLLVDVLERGSPPSYRVLYDTFTAVIELCTGILCMMSNVVLYTPRSVALPVLHIQLVQVPFSQYQLRSSCNMLIPYSFANSNVCLFSIAATERGNQVLHCFLATDITTSLETRGPFNRLHIVLDAGHLAV
jgi:hypothetical protein